MNNQNQNINWHKIREGARVIHSACANERIAEVYRRYPGENIYAIRISHAQAGGYRRIYGADLEHRNASAALAQAKQIAQGYLRKEA